MRLLLRANVYLTAAPVLLIISGSFVLTPEASAQQTAVRDSIPVTFGFVSWRTSGDLYRNCGTNVYGIHDDPIGRGIGSGDYRYTYGPSDSDAPDGAPPDIPGVQVTYHAGGGSGSAPREWPKCGSIASRVRAAWAGFKVWAVYELPEPRPIAKFTWEQTEGLTVRLDGAPSYVITAQGRRPVASYSWSHGDNRSASAASHTFLQPGEYPVSLTVFDGEGNSDTYTETVTVTSHQLTLRSVPLEPGARYTEGDTLVVETTLENTGSGSVLDVVLPPFTEPMGRLDAPPGATLVRPAEMARLSTREPETRAVLAIGEIITVLDTIVVVSEGTYRLEGQTVSVDTEAWAEVQGEIQASSGIDEPVQVVRPCDGGGCETWTVGPAGARLTVRTQIATRQAFRGDTVVVRVDLENEGDVDLLDVVVPSDVTFSFSYADSLDGLPIEEPVLTPLTAATDTTLDRLEVGEEAVVDFRFRVDQIAMTEVAVTSDSVVVRRVEADVTARLEGVAAVTDTDAREPVAGVVEDPTTCTVDQVGARRSAMMVNPEAMPRGVREPCVGKLSPATLQLKTQLELDELFAIGETYKIEWSNLGVKAVEIRATTKRRPKLEDFDIVLAEQASTAALASFDWEVKEEHMSPHFRLVVIDASSDDPDRERAFSARLRVRDPWHLTRIVEDDDGNLLYEPFETGTHAWSQRNTQSDWWPYPLFDTAQFTHPDSLQYQDVLNGYDPSYAGDFTRYNPRTKFREAAPGYQPSWRHYVEAYGPLQVYTNLLVRPDPKTGQFYNRPVVVPLLQFIVEGPGSAGVCWGLSASALAGFLTPAALHQALHTSGPDVGGISSVTPLIRNKVNAWHMYQRSAGVKGQHAAYQQAYPTTLAVLERLKELFESDDPTDRDVILVWNTRDLRERGTTYGHAVLPYRIEEDSENGFTRVFIYDSNYGQVADRYLTVFMDTGRWIYPTSIWSGGPNSGKNRLELTGGADLLFQKATPFWNRPSFFGSAPAADVAQSVTQADGHEPLRLMLRSSDVRIESAAGTVLTYADSVVANAVEGAEVEFAWTGLPSLPAAYLLPRGPYTVDVRTDDSLAVLGLERQGEWISLSARSAGPSQVRMTLSEDGPVQVSGGEAALTGLNLGVMLSMSARERRSWTIDGLTVDASDTLRYSVDPSGEAIRLTGATGTYALLLDHFREGKGAAYTFPDVDQEPGSSHTIQPDWSTDSLTVTVLIDHDSDGTVDTEQKLEPDAVLVTNEHRAAPAPETFSVSAYPNPMRQRGHVAIDLPLPARVQVAAYDVLGRRVAALHDATLSAGRHTLSIDLSEIPSGLYLLRTTAGDRSSTHHVMVIR